MQTIRTRLTLNYLLVLSLGMALAGIFAWFAVEQSYVQTQRDNLLAQARLIASALGGGPLPNAPAGAYTQTANVQPGIHTRLLDESGAVVVGLPQLDSTANIQLPLAEQEASIPPSELVRRPEIDSALHGLPATTLRRVTGGRRVLYAAAPVRDAAGQVRGVVYIATPLPASGLPWNVILEILAAVLFAVAIATIAGRLLARKITRPLEGLARAAHAIAGGDLGPLPRVEADVAELHDLDQAFGEMAESLRQSDQAKKAFVADVTHELRTPLTVIKGTIETLEDGALDDHSGRGPLLASMQRETDRLIRLVNELLILTRADADVLGLDLQNVDLTQLTRERCEHMSLLAWRASLDLKVISESKSTVCGDRDRLAQVLDNLLDNAIRHAPESSAITVTIRDQEDMVECSVRDGGSGIPPGHLPFIFERFYRVDAARGRTSGGTGLGLAIARAIIRAHRGTISVHSDEGQGTTFTFRLPR